MAEILWNPGKAAQIGNLQGQMTGFIAGAYSLPGMANISAAPTEVLNQNGYTVYQDDENGHYKLKQDNHVDDKSIWTSQTMGVTFDCSGDKLTITGIDEKEDDEGKIDNNNTGEAADKSNPENTGVNASQSSFGMVTSPTGFDYDAYTNNSRSAFASNSQNILNRLSASQNAGVNYSSTAGLNSNETIDPITHSTVDKEKSEAIDKLNLSEATKHKFDKIAKLIDKVYEKQSKAEVEAVDKSGDYAVTAGVAVGAVGALAGAGKGGAIGAAIGSVIPLAGTAAGAAIGAAIGGIAGAVGGWLTGKAVKAHEDGKAENINNDAINEAQAAGDDLKEALEELSDEELVAFQRYYNQKYGSQVTDVLRSLETDEDSSEIAQGAGIDSGYLTEVFENIDGANEMLKPDETAEAEVASSGAKEISYSEAAQIEVLQQEIQMSKQYWQSALQNGGSIEINGKTMTTDELSKMYIEANKELEQYLDNIEKGEKLEVTM